VVDRANSSLIIAKGAHIAQAHGIPTIMTTIVADGTVVMKYVLNIHTAKTRCEHRQMRGREREGKVVRNLGRKRVEVREVRAKRSEAWVAVRAVWAVVDEVVGWREEM
jgi:hypothetical protein